MQELVISFGSGGQVASMHSDKFHLGFLGGVQVTRQSDILFNESSQLWGIHYIKEDKTLHTAEPLQGFGTYESARQFEVRWLNDCRLVGVDPVGEAGLGLAATLEEV